MLFTWITRSDKYENQEGYAPNGVRAISGTIFSSRIQRHFANVNFCDVNRLQNVGGDAVSKETNVIHNDSIEFFRIK